MAEYIFEGVYILEIQRRIVKKLQVYTSDNKWIRFRHANNYRFMLFKISARPMATELKNNRTGIAAY